MSSRLRLRLSLMPGKVYTVGLRQVDVHPITSDYNGFTFRDLRARVQFRVWRKFQGVSEIFCFNADINEWLGRRD